ncbi:MAG: glycosyltransferase [Alphaproteobacteria bacterium]|nr:glycosyltransferase [Alphaproteobacteria bacterium]
MSESTETRPLISLVVPVLNEEDNLGPLVERVDAVMTQVADRYAYELVFTDNHSDDSTWQKLEALAAQRPDVQAYRFSKNFGYQKSIRTGYLKARGAAAIQLDGDLQDPPELIPEFLGHWEAGSKVVYGIRRSRKEGGMVTSARRAFYWLIDALSEDPLPRDAGDFRLIDRQVIEVLRADGDVHPYIRGRIAAIGFTQTGIPYDRSARQAGDTKFQLWSLVRLAIDGITSHSAKPLRLATYLGIGTMAGSFLAGLVYLSARIIFGVDWPAGFATLVVMVLFFSGLNSLLLGLMGEYVARIFEQLKQSPDTLIEASLNDPDTDR